MPTIEFWYKVTLLRTPSAVFLQTSDSLEVVRDSSHIKFPSVTGVGLIYIQIYTPYFNSQNVVYYVRQ